MFEQDQSSSCNDLVLFLSDGEDPSFNISKIADDHASQPDVQVLTYALDSGADASKLKEIACATDGISFSVDDPDSLVDVMTRYFLVSSTKVDSCKIKYIEYTDAISGDTLLSSCTSLYDYNSDNRRTLYGVLCQDINMIISLSLLQSCDNYDTLLNAMRDQSMQCSTSRTALTKCELQKLRVDLSGTTAVCPSQPDHASCTDVFPNEGSSNCDSINSDMVALQSIQLSSCDSDQDSACRITSAPTPQTPIEDDDVTDTRGGDDEESGMSPGAIAGSVVAVLAGVAVVVFAVVRQQKKANENNDAGDTNGAGDNNDAGDPNGGDGDSRSQRNDSVATEVDLPDGTSTSDIPMAITVS